MTGEGDNRRARRSQQAVRRLLILSFAVVAVVLVGAAAVLATGSRLLDELKVREDRFLIANALDRIMTRVVSNMTTVTVWDQAYANMKPGGDMAWADAEIGGFYANNRGFERTVAVDGHDAPFYAWVGKARADPATQAQFLADAMPLVRQVRAAAAARGDRRPKAEPTDPSLAETARGIVLSGGVRYLVGASTVAPSAYAGPRRPGPAVVVITAQALDARMLFSLQRMHIPGAAIGPAVSGRGAVVPLKDVNGRAVGAITWTPEHSGVVALRGAVPALVLGLLMFGAVMAILGWQILRVTRELDTYETAHDAAMADLAEARDRAETANVAKSQFLANMSHEIRTPLNGVLGMAQVLARTDLSPDAQEKVAVIRNSGETLLSLLNDVLDLSKIEAGRMQVDRETFDLALVVEGATRAFAEAAGSKGVAFAVEIDPGAAGLWSGDAGKLRQILTNLVSNAVKFTRAGQVRVSLRRTGAGLSGAVTDTGAGIPGEQLAQLFKRFSQVDPTSTRKFGGSGLGLAISQELADLLGGSISVASVEGRGSTFSFDLPFDWIGPKPVDAVAQPAAEEADPELPALQVLAAEDNKTNQLLLTAMLQPLGVTLRMVDDGAQAVEAFRHDRFHLVLMDIQMPVMNGVEAVRQIRAMEDAEGRQPTPILALSANAMRHQVEEYMAVGMDGFVAKPIVMNTLLTSIEKALADAA